MDKIDRNAARVLSEAAREALQAVADEHGLEVKIGGGRYDPHVGTFSPKVTFSLPDAQRRNFENGCRLVNLQPSDFGRVVTIAGKRFEICGVNLRARTYPVLAKCGGKTYKLSEQSVLAAIARAA